MKTESSHLFLAIDNDLRQ